MLSCISLAVPKFSSRELGRVSNFYQSINWHPHIKDHVEVCHLTEYDAFRVNRDQVMELEIWFKIHTNVYNFKTASLKTIQIPQIFSHFFDDCKIPSCTGSIIKMIGVYMILGDAVPKLETFVWIRTIFQGS